MTYGDTLKDSDWKEQFLTHKQGDRDMGGNVHKELAEQPLHMQKFKARAVELVENGVNRREEIVDELECSPGLASKVVDELKEEKVLEVKNR